MHKRLASGTSKPSPIKSQLPKILPYSPFIPYSQSHIKNLYCYIIRHYGYVGFSVLIYRQPNLDQVAVACGDWSGQVLDLQDKSPLANAAKEFLSAKAAVLINILHTIKLTQIQLYLATPANSEPILVDAQISINQMCGPGMIKDVFGRACSTQEVLGIEVIDDRIDECIANNTGTFSGNIIIKPSRYRTQHEVSDNSYAPLYVEVIQ